MIRRIIRRITEVIRQEIGWYRLRVQTRKPDAAYSSGNPDYRMMRGAR
jgi:hypothetical protein